MTRWFIDTEFWEHATGGTPTIDLLSIALVSDLGDEYYAVVNDLELINQAAEASPWLHQNVIPQLPVRSTFDGWNWDPSHPDMARLSSRRQIAAEVQRLMGLHADPQLWAWYGAYDHVAMCWLWGRMADLPPGVPMWTNDLKQECVRLGDPEVPAQIGTAHSAWGDARHNKVIANFLDEIQADEVRHLRTECDSAGRCRHFRCGRCKRRTNNALQGHYWAWCRVTKSVRDYHFCCPSGCELEVAQ